MNALPLPQPDQAGEAMSWPQGLSHRPTMSIGQVLDLLTAQFPHMTISKLRYLEGQGLLSPSRTASRYRQYSAADVERIRFILKAQRDRFWPLRVIREHLAAMDAGDLGPGQEETARPGPREVGAAAAAIEEIITATGASQELVDEVIAAAGVSRADAQANATALIQAVEAASALASFGLEVRHLRSVFSAARRQADVVEQATSALQAAGSAGREKAAAQAQDIAGSLDRLHTAVLRLELTTRGL